MEGFLHSKGVDSPRVCAQLLLSRVLQCERTRLYMEMDRPTSRAELDALRALVQRAGGHEPVQYVVGEAWFWSKRFAVAPCTLIPRPCTENLVEHVVREVQRVVAARQSQPSGPADEQSNPHASRAPPIRILEIGTGTGCIAVCIASALRHGQRRGGDPQAVAAPVLAVEIVATDLVPAALELARANALAHGVHSQIEFRSGDLYSALDGMDAQGSFDVLVSNPPYVADDEWDALAPNVREYEPRTALAGGVRGMDVIAPLLAQAHTWLRPGGLLAVEMGHHQQAIVLAAAQANPYFEEASTHKDFEDFWRILTARRAIHPRADNGPTVTPRATQ
jgi:release factor glutamine methyltransferase